MTSLEVVKKALSEHLGQSDYQPDQTLSSLGLDSLDFLEVLMLIEDEVNVDLDEERFKLSMTIQQFSEVLDEFI